MTQQPLPDVGSLIRPLVEALPPAVQPRLIAKLEQAAADRYDAWATVSGDPAEADGLRACARREREIAAQVERVVRLQPEEQRQCAEALPGIAAAFGAAMGDRPLREQYAIQAAAERSGAAFWRAVATMVPEASARAVFAKCAELEEESAAFLESRLAATR